MKVAVVGTFCSGKSTLVDDLAAAITDGMPVSDECRPVLDVYPRIDWRNEEVRSYLTVRQLLVEAAPQHPGTTLIVDGGMVNIFAHDRGLLMTAPNRLPLLEQFGHSRYDATLWCDPGDIALIDDGQRYTDTDLRQTIHRHVGDVLRELDYDAVFLSGDRQARTAAALAEIGRHA